jgi:chemotaxis-related protein WspD
VEVNEPRPIHSLPNRRNRIVLGIVNIRGRLMPCVSLAEFLGIAQQSQPETAEHNRLIIAGNDEVRVAIPANEVHGVHRYRAREVQPAPSTLLRSNYTTGIVAWNGKSVACLNSETVLMSLKKSLS